MTPDELRKNIDTIVIVMMENRSFDHVLGTMRMRAYGGRTDIEGIDDVTNSDYGNPSANGTLVQPFIATDEQFISDLPHDRASVATQLAHSPISGYVMNGFVAAYEHANGTSGTDMPPPMGLLTPGQIPVTNFLAREFAICDQWFAPIPTSTHPNRLMALSGYTKIEDTPNKPLPDQDLLFDWLTERAVPWRVYSAGLPFLTLMPKMWRHLVNHDLFRGFERLAHDVQTEADDSFPKVLVVEPDYDDSPVHISGHACDNHPPLAMAFGEMFLRQVYDALTSNPKRWSKTLMVLMYDEHGGFFDHVPPRLIPFAPPPGVSFKGFESTGPRVPVVLVSPWVKRKSASSAVFDHTSVLQLLAERFDNVPYSDGVEERRKAGITSVSVALDAAVGGGDAPDMPAINLSASVNLSTVNPPTTAARQAFADCVTEFSKDGAALERYPAIAQWTASK